MDRSTKKFALAAASLAIALSWSVGATLAEDSARAMKPAFTVWTSSGCSRTLQQSAGCDSAYHACRKARELSQDEANKFVMIVSGEPQWAQVLDLFDHLRDGRELKQPHEFSVFVPGCRLGFSHYALEEGVTVSQAEQMIKDGSGRIGGGMVIYNLLPATVAAN